MRARSMGPPSIAQPLIAPLYAGDPLRRCWLRCSGIRAGGPRALTPPVEANVPDDGAWNAALQSRRDPRYWLRDALLSSVSAEFLSRAPHVASTASTQQRPRIVVSSGPDHRRRRWANNGWLQELPKPLTQLTWDNAALISPGLAEQHSLSNGDLVELRLGERTLRVPVWIMPGQATHSVTLHLGYGRRAGPCGRCQGFDAYRCGHRPLPGRARTDDAQNRRRNTRSPAPNIISTWRAAN